MTEPQIPPAVAAAARQAALAESAQIVSTLLRLTGDWDLAEDCMQDAMTRALSVWARDGIPQNPGAWLTSVAKNRAIDLLRRAAAERRAIATLGAEQRIEEQGEGDDMDGTPTGSDTDDRLALIFTCCHPALSMDARVALTLRTVAGLGVPEIARAFLVTVPTMERRLVRARARIKNAGIPYRVPPVESRADRVSGVLAVLYLLFNEGYSSTGDAELVRAPIADEAIRLARMLREALGESPVAGEAASLLALLLLQNARRASRVGDDGEIVTLEEQDRSAWDRVAIREAVVLLDEVESRLVHDGARPGSYWLQASIAACHAVAPTFASTDFGRIVALYRELRGAYPSPVADLNHAVAVAMAEGPAAGLRLVEALDEGGELADYHLLPATRADLLRRLDRSAEAAVQYRRALLTAPSAAERRYLEGRIRELGGIR